MEGPVPGLGCFGGGVGVAAGRQHDLVSVSCSFDSASCQSQPECVLVYTKLGPGWSIRLGALLLHRPLAGPYCCTSPKEGLACKSA